MIDSPSTIAVVPVRDLSNAKTRLAGILSPAKRQRLMQQMVRRVLSAALDAESILSVVVVSPDPNTRRWVSTAEPPVVTLVQDPSAPGLNAAIDAGRVYAQAIGASAMVAIFGDLPLLTAAEVDELAQRDAEVVLAPDRHGTGTNALLLRFGAPAAGEFHFQYGSSSFARHHAEAERLGLSVVTSIARGTACDLDTPDDWVEVAGSLNDDSPSLTDLTPIALSGRHPGEWAWCRDCADR